MNEKELVIEFDRQVATLLYKGYPKAANLPESEFLRLLAPLRDVASKLTVSAINLDAGYLPFVVVIKNELVPTRIAMDMVEKNDKRGITKLFPLNPNDFQTLDEEQIPSSPIYLMRDIDRGKETINIPPNEALVRIRESHRFPLTIDEGIAIVTQFPGFLFKNNCFSLLASRHPGDKRVPAIWINTKKEPNLGWCWDGNPHTWLGSASCGSRLG